MVSLILAKLQRWAKSQAWVWIPVKSRGWPNDQLPRWAMKIGQANQQVMTTVFKSWEQTRGHPARWQREQPVPAHTNKTPVFWRSSPALPKTPCQQQQAPMPHIRSRSRKINELQATLQTPQKKRLRGTWCARNLPNCPKVQTVLQKVQIACFLLPTTRSKRSRTTTQQQTNIQLLTIGHRELIPIVSSWKQEATLIHVQERQQQGDSRNGHQQNTVEQRCLNERDQPLHNICCIFHLATLLEWHGCMRIPTGLILDKLKESCNLWDKIKNCSICVEMRRETCGLPQAGILANELLQKRLFCARMLQSQALPPSSPWTHNAKKTDFTLVVDGFGLKHERCPDSK